MHVVAAIAETPKAVTEHKLYWAAIADRAEGWYLHAIRCPRVALHGFVSLEAAGGFGLPQSVDVTFARLIDSLDATFSRWAEPATSRSR
jgi:hypothetical protein